MRFFHRLWAATVRAWITFWSFPTMPDLHISVELQDALAVATADHAAYVAADSAVGEASAALEAASDNLDDKIDDKSVAAHAAIESLKLVQDLVVKEFGIPVA